MAFNLKLFLTILILVSTLYLATLTNCAPTQVNPAGVEQINSTQATNSNQESNYEIVSKALIEAMAKEEKQFIDMLLQEEARAKANGNLVNQDEDFIFFIVT